MEIWRVRVKQGARWASYTVAGRVFVKREWTEVRTSDVEGVHLAEMERSEVLEIEKPKPRSRRQGAGGKRQEAGAKKPEAGGGDADDG